MAPRDETKAEASGLLQLRDKRPRRKSGWSAQGRVPK